MRKGRNNAITTNKRIAKMVRSIGEKKPKKEKFHPEDGLAKNKEEMCAHCANRRVEGIKLCYYHRQRSREGGQRHSDAKPKKEKPEPKRKSEKCGDDPLDVVAKPTEGPLLRLQE